MSVFFWFFKSFSTFASLIDFKIPMQKPSVEICFTPDAVSFVNLTDKIVVVVDIFRATSCMVAGLANGVQEVIPVANIADALHYQQQGYITAGERNGEKVDGFEIGNSPFEHMAQKGKKIVMTTTNGTQAIEAVKHETLEVIIGAFLNLSAVADYLIKKKQSTLIVCAGWKGRFNAEDSLFAGALALKLESYFDWKGDETLCATHSYKSAQNNLLEMLKGSSHYQRLSDFGVQGDMEFCLEVDKYNIVPILKSNVLKII